MLTLLLILLGFGLVIGIHEGSHMFVSKLLGVKVLRFALGFGPILVSKTFGETSYELRLLPLGGFVQCDGESPEDNVKRGFFSLSWWKRSLIALAGPVSNLILSILLLLIVLWFLKGWPLFAGLERAFQIVLLTTFKFFVGIHPHPLPTTDVASAQLAGPIMITKMLVSSIKEGASSFLLLLSLISLSLGIFNLLPVPAMDGGHVFLYLLEGIRGKKFSTKIYMLWNTFGYVLIILIMLLACFNDITTILK